MLNEIRFIIPKDGGTIAIRPDRMLHHPRVGEHVDLDVDGMWVVQEVRWIVGKDHLVVHLQSCTNMVCCV